MNSPTTWFLLLVLACASAAPRSVFAQETETAPIAQKSKNEPQGKLTKFVFKDSKIFPGTQRDVWIYVPQQYSDEKAACLAAFCDGQAYVNPDRDNYAPAIFDKLIAAEEMPVTIGVFANPGVVPPTTANALPRFNRSYEYDGLGDDYARFLDEELLPFITKKFNLNISPEPNDRMVGGASSGGVCAFNTAWARPDKFRRVWCTVGTFVGLRGGDELHSLVRKTEAKPLRIFLHDGSNDLNIYAGDWWMANQQMQRALQWMGYEQEFKWDDAGHGRSGEMKYFADGLRFLWKDWPAPVKTHPENSGERRGEFLVPDEPWQIVSIGQKSTDGITSNGEGDVFFSDSANSTIHKIDSADRTNLFAENTGKASGLAFGPDGKLYACVAEKGEVVAYAADTSKVANATSVTGGVFGKDLCIRADGTIYATSARKDGIMRISPDRKSLEMLSSVSDCQGIVFSPDQSQIYVSSSSGRMATAIQVQQNGGLINAQPFYWLHSPYRTDLSMLGAMTVDTDGWLYVASKLGIQICDQAGRVNFIIPMPAETQHPSNICFGGPNMDCLFAACGDKVLKRKLKTKGLHSWKAPVTPAKPRL